MGAKSQLFKDLLLAVLGFGFFYVLSSIGKSPSEMDILYSFICCGFIFGWKLLEGKVFVFGIYTFAIKLALSALIGIVAMPIILVRDVVDVCHGY